MAKRKTLEFTRVLSSHWPDSNRRPTHYECVALPTALQKRPNKNALDKNPKHMTSSGIEPEFTPWEGVVLTAWPWGQNRGDKIRTCDLCVPNAALYQTEPRLDVFKALCFVLFTSDSYIIAWPWKKCKRFFEKISIFWKKVISENLPGSGESPQSLIL